MTMVSRLELVVDQRLDLIFEKLRLQDERMTRLGQQNEKIYEMMAQVNWNNIFRQTYFVSELAMP